MQSSRRSSRLSSLDKLLIVIILVSALIWGKAVIAKDRATPAFKTTTEDVRL